MGRLGTAQISISSSVTTGIYGCSDEYPVHTGGPIYSDYVPFYSEVSDSTTAFSEMRGCVARDAR